MNDNDLPMGEVLVVEDTPSSLKLLTDLLTRAGYLVRQAPDGELALWSAQAKPPELVLLDVRMPGIDGYEVCRRLKSSEALRDIPVVFLSAQSDTDDKVRGFQAGGIDFIGKPYQAEEVLARTKAHIALARTQRALAASNAELSLALNQLDSAREELRRTERLAALGSMVAGIAHELNTPIGNCVLASSTLDERARAFASAMAGGLRRSQLEEFVADTISASSLLQRNLAASAELISSFKQVATDQASSVRRRFDMAQLVQDMIISLAPQVRGSDVTIDNQVVPGIAMESYPGALCQIISHLVFNAMLHAFGDGRGGVITFSASSEGGQLTFSLCDNGAGIAAADLTRIFDPFFTTRLGQGSSGLGLHIVHNLVTNVLGGTIEARSGEGKTCFVLHCPCTAPALASA
jgi:DNA-binding response OmpR family regulator/two-component sensor histidine kinase